MVPRKDATNEEMAHSCEYCTFLLVIVSAVPFRLPGPSANGQIQQYIDQANFRTLFVLPLSSR